jgi:hypothetical protein
MDFDDCGYELQQVQARTRREKVRGKTRDDIEKSRLAERVEGHQRYVPPGDLVASPPDSSLHISDIDRFNRDYTEEQRTTRRILQGLTLARAGANRRQLANYMQYIEERRAREQADSDMITRHYARHDFCRESVLYDPVTCIVPTETTDKGRTQRSLDALRENSREARALSIQHRMHSTDYNPITGDARPFW